MTIDQWISVIKDAVARYSTPLTGGEVKALQLQYVPGDPLSALSERILEPVIREIFARGRDGTTFGDPGRLQNDILYGSVESAFPNASATFLNLTRAFLTFWKEYKDIAHEEPRIALQVFLLAFIDEHKKRFFPGATVTKPVPYDFAGEQRDALNAFGKGIDIEDFFRSNPLFIGSAPQIKGTGCLLMIVGSIGWALACLWLSIPKN